MDQNLKLLIVDDHVLFCNGLEQIIKQHITNAEVVIVNNPLLGLELPLSTFDLILVDMDMPQIKGFEFIKRARDQYEDLKFMIVTMHNKLSIIRKVQKEKIMGYMLKDDDAIDFLNGILSILDGNEYYSKQVIDTMLQSPKEEIVLTLREEEILNHLAQGLSMQEIAEDFSISLETVKTHAKNIKSKLKVGNKAELIKYAIDNLIL
ncbi:response regulator transcription factor [Sediminitomix flava]|uniref:LuxR family two component transcriptional regulator n=1 Tax=Sediminitomix flava TaxID=379075 RepID=A0A315ZGC4_SEDFL|nr:response regulator transcription factor [Sediminitomix flava]PWJ44382.1 LuxR family two component transcriptional regulator [Sediminitomix flava]